MKNKDNKPDLQVIFSEIIGYPDLRKKQSRELINHRKAIATDANIFSGLNVTSAYDIPVLKKYEIDIPARMLPYNSWNAPRDLDAALCFYTHEYRYGILKTNLGKALIKISKAPCVIFPDFSQTSDMPYWKRFHNSCLNKAYGAKFQQLGINVVANVTWSLPDSYEYCFIGIPQHCVIAINSMGANANGVTRYLWQQGYKEALKALRPTFILRYGPIMPNECTSISRYYENPFIKSMRYGSKR